MYYRAKKASCLKKVRCLALGLGRVKNFMGQAGPDFFLSRQVGLGNGSGQKNFELLLMNFFSFKYC